jgi:acyl-CoA thioesterase-1
MALKPIILVIALVALANGSSCQARAAAPAIAVLGDSLSAGYGLEPDESWVTLLDKRLAEEGYGYRVINASITGDTTAGGLNRLPGLLRRESPRLVILELGGNDGLRGLPVPRMKQNLRSMIELSKSAGAQVVLAGIQIPPNYGQGYTHQFKQVFEDLALDPQVVLVEFILEGVALDPELMQLDGIHPNALGQPRILDNVWEAVAPLLEVIEAPQ